MVRNEKGSVLRITLVLVTVAILIGVVVNRESTQEIFIAANDVDGKRAFYSSEAGLAAGRELLEQNIACPEKGFAYGAQVYDETVWVIQKDESATRAKFWEKTYEGVDIDRCTVKANADIWLRSTDTYIAYSYKSMEPGDGASTLMAEGGEGFGFGTSHGGGFLAYDIWAECLGPPNADAVLKVEYRHLLGQEEECHY